MYTIGAGENKGGRDMTWEEITKKYDRDSKEQKPEQKLDRFGKNWDTLVKSTDKLVWLFSLSGNKRQIKNS